MVRKWATVLLSLLILTTTAASQELGPICRPGDSTEQKIGSQTFSKWLKFTQYGQSVCENTEKRIGYRGFDHCRLHADYQKVFPQAGCNCYTGQCRPTEWRLAKAHTADNPDGIEIYISGGWYPIPAGVLHKFYGDAGPRAVPMNMLDYDAHVCASDPSPGNPPQIECAWIKDPS